MESERNNLIIKDPTKIGRAKGEFDSNAANLITSNEFGFNASAGYGYQRGGQGYQRYGRNPRSRARGARGYGNVFGGTRFRAPRGTRGTRGGARGNRGYRRSRFGRYNYNTVGTRAFSNTNVENVNWKNWNNIRQFGASIEPSRRREIALSRVQAQDRKGALALYSINWRDGALREDIPMKFDGTCNKCSRWGHMSRHHEFLAEVMPRLMERYETQDTTQVNLTSQMSFEELTQNSVTRAAKQASALLMNFESVKVEPTKIKSENQMGSPTVNNVKNEAFLADMQNAFR